MPETLNQRWAAQLVGALVACGVRQAVVAPGSRSTPLALAFADHPDVTVHSVIDERSGAFVALGRAQADGAPAAVLCTSGTAGAHFLPAVMEALAGATPLVVITADRPWTLHGFGAPQTAEQVGLFGPHVVDEAVLPAPLEGDAALEHLAAVVARSVSRAVAAPGPVHLNAPFDEPLAPVDATPGPVRRVEVTRFLSTRGVPEPQALRAAIAGARSGVIVCGPRHRDDGFGAAVHALGERLGFAVLAEAASNARYGFGGAITRYDAMVRSEDFAAALRPDVVLRFGGGLTSKALTQWLDGGGAQTWIVADDARVFDPLHAAAGVVHADAVAVCRALMDASPAQGSTRTKWLAAERAFAGLAAGAALVPARADRRSEEAQAARADRSGGTESGARLDEPTAAAALVASLPPGASLVVSSSMPIRDVDAFASRAAGPLRVFSNRGVNGIDGVLSTAIGVATASQRPTAVLLGDVAALHDLSGWVTARRLGVSLAAVVVNNDGGGIFSFLPVHGRTAHFETLFGTPHGVDFAHAAALGGATLHRPVDLASYRAALTHALEGGLHLIEVRVDRSQTVARHRAATARLTEALEEAAWR